MVMHPHLMLDPGDLVKGRAALHHAGVLIRDAPLVQSDDGRIGIPAMSMVEVGLGAWEHHALRTRAARDPHERLRRAVASLDGITEAHLESLPKRWERLQDLILLPVHAFEDDLWNGIDRPSLHDAILGAFRAERLGRQGPIKPGALRRPSVQMLVGSEGWVEHQEHGVRYGFDVTRAMFSSGNVSERGRIGEMDLSGEVVVDAFAGIGYYTLPMLVRGRARHVHACEMNPDSLRGLRWGLSANGVDDRCTVHAGDNADHLPSLAGCADRVHLGLSPTSEGAWASGAKALRIEGGCMHIHANVKEERVESEGNRILASIREILGVMPELTHVERVKWYAPRVLHAVYDLRVPAR